MAAEDWPRHLEPRFLRALASEWRRVNRVQFKGALQPCTFELTDAANRHGSWSAGTRTIAIARALVHKEPWGTVVEVLRHEMAHQYVHEVLRAAEGEPSHGPAFREVCQRLAIDAGASGLPPPSEADLRVQRRIRKLLALAGSNNPHEAQAAMNRAHRLMLEHNIALVPEAYTWRHLGRLSSRRQQWERTLASILARHFFVDVVWARVFDVVRNAWRIRLEVCGTPGNVEMAAWVHGWLTATAERLWRSPPVRTRGARGRYLAGVMQGFISTLRERAEAARVEGLVWAGDPGLKGFLRRRHGALRMIRSTFRAGDPAFVAGFAQGQRIVLHRPIGEDGTSRGRLLAEGGRPLLTDRGDG